MGLLDFLLLLARLCEVVKAILELTALRKKVGQDADSHERRPKHLRE